MSAAAAVRLGAPALAAVAFVAASCAAPAAPIADEETTSFVTSDSVTVFVHRWAMAADSTRPIVLAFHQAGANGRSEYGPMAKRLLAEGFDLVAADQRSGGDRFGGENMTVARLGASTGYCEAMPDLEAAVAAVHARRPHAPIVLWGSSYSAALVLRLAAGHPDGVAAVCAFSPASGGPMADCRGEDVSEGIEVPVLVLRPASELSNESVVRQGEVFRAQGHGWFVSDPGTHGASMLVDARAGGDTGATWDAVLAFMQRAVAPPAPDAEAPDSE